jgi:hypothetical protein
MTTEGISMRKSQWHLFSRAPLAFAKLENGVYSVKAVTPNDRYAYAKFANLEDMLSHIGAGYGAEALKEIQYLLQGNALR